MSGPLIGGGQLIEGRVGDRFVAFQDIFGDFNNIGKRDLVAAKSVDGRFVGGVEDGSAGAAFSGDLVSEAQGGEPVRIGRLEIHSPQGFDVEAISGSPKPHAPAFVDTEILLSYEPGASEQTKRGVERAEKLSLIRTIPHLRVRHYRLPPGAKVQATCDRLTRNPAIRAAEPNYKHRLFAIPTDPRFSEQ